MPRLCQRLLCLQAAGQAAELRALLSCRPGPRRRCRPSAACALRSLQPCIHTAARCRPLPSLVGQRAAHIPRGKESVTKSEQFERYGVEMTRNISEHSEGKAKYFE